MIVFWLKKIIGQFIKRSSLFWQIAKKVEKVFIPLKSEELTIFFLQKIWFHVCKLFSLFSSFFSFFVWKSVMSFLHWRKSLCISVSSDSCTYLDSLGIATLKINNTICCRTSEGVYTNTPDIAVTGNHSNDGTENCTN